MRNLTNLEAQMVSRVRRYMLMTFAGVIGLILLAALLGVLSRSAVGSDSTMATLGPRLAAGLAMLLAPAIVIYALFKNIRCPSCERTVIRQTMGVYSLFGASVPRTCGSCKAKIFPDDTNRFVRYFVILGAIGVVLGVVRIFLGR